MNTEKKGRTVEEAVEVVTAIDEAIACPSGPEAEPASVETVLKTFP